MLKEDSRECILHTVSLRSGSRTQLADIFNRKSLPQSTLVARANTYKHPPNATAATPQHTAEPEQQKPSEQQNLAEQGINQINQLCNAFDSQAEIWLCSNWRASVLHLCEVVVRAQATKDWHDCKVPSFCSQGSVGLAKTYWAVCLHSASAHCLDGVVINCLPVPILKASEKKTSKRPTSDHVFSYFHTWHHFGQSLRAFGQPAQL